MRNICAVDSPGWQRIVRAVAVFLLASACFATQALAAAAGDAPGAKDWMNSPLVGGGVVPDGETEVFFSTYLDRVLSLDEKKYVFDASLYVFLSWVDPRAPGDVANATAETTAPGGRDCARLCIGQRAPTDQSQCCDMLWLPSFVIRNADEMPQGRLQPYYIAVDDAGVVTWRVEFRSNFYTSLNVQAFPFDSQRLEILMQLVNLNPEQSRVKVTPSARGLRLFSLGWGDDLSSFKTKSILLEVWSTPFSKQFNRAVGQVESRSNSRDPAPLVPALVRDPAGGDKLVEAMEPFGSRLEVVNVIVVIVLTRLWQYYIIAAVVPILTATVLSFVVFGVPPSKLDTRLQTTIALFLSLVALQFVMEDDLPKSSYVIPTRILVLASYVIIGLIAVESLVVFNLWHWPEVRSRLEGRRAAVRYHSEQMRLRMSIDRGGSFGSGRRRSFLISKRWATGNSASDGGGGGESGGGDNADRRERGWANQLAASVSRRRSPANSGGPAAGGGGGGGERGGASSSATTDGGRLDAESRTAAAAAAGGGLLASDEPPSSGDGGCNNGDGNSEAAQQQQPLPPHQNRGAHRASFGGSGGGGGAGAASATAAAAASSTSGGGARLLDAELEEALWHFRANRVDAVSFVSLLALYLITALLIFVISELAARRSASEFLYMV